MTIETRMCKPIDEIPFDRVQNLVFEYRKLERFFEACDGDIELCTGTINNSVDGTLKDMVLRTLQERLDQIEESLNVLGYTMDDKPKEWQYHVNVLKGESND